MSVPDRKESKVSDINTTSVDVSPPLDLLNGALTFFNGVDVTDYLVRVTTQDELGQDHPYVHFTLMSSVRFDFHEGLEIEVIVRPALDNDDLNLKTDLFASRKAEEDISQWVLHVQVIEYKLGESHHTVEVLCAARSGGHRYVEPSISERTFWEYLVNCATGDRVHFKTLEDAMGDLRVTREEVDALFKVFMDKSFIRISLKVTDSNSGDAVPSDYFCLTREGYDHFGVEHMHDTADITRGTAIELLRMGNFQPAQGPEFEKAVDEVYRRMLKGPDYRSSHGLLQNLPLDCEYTWEIAASEPR